MIYFLCIVLFLLASLLVFPVGVGLDYSDRGKRWYVLWMWLPIPVTRLVARAGQKRKGPQKPKAVKPEEDKGEKKSLKQKIHDLVEGMRSGKEMFESGLRTLRSVTHHLRIKVRRLNVIFATPNPAATGFGYGMMWALAGAVNPSWPTHVEPDFTRTSSVVDFRVEARITVIKVVPAAWRLWRDARARRKRDEDS